MPARIRIDPKLLHVPWRLRYLYTDDRSSGHRSCTNADTAVGEIARILRAAIRWRREVSIWLESYDVGSRTPTDVNAEPLTQRLLDGIPDDDPYGTPEAADRAAVLGALGWPDPNPPQPVIITVT